MAMLGEEVVVEWLNRLGYFTIRGIRLGNNEIDVLAIKPADGGCECRHIEVAVSIIPIGYISNHNAKRLSDSELKQDVDKWVEKKFNQRALKLKESLCQGSWTKELVIGKIKYEHEIEMLNQNGVTVHRLKDIIKEMGAPDRLIKSAAGAALFDLMMLFREKEMRSGR